VLVTHDQDEALSTADRVAVLRDGRIAQCDAPQNLYDRPADADIARFIGDANLIDGVLGDGMVETILGRLPVDPSCPASLASGPVFLADGPAALSAGSAAVLGHVTVLVRPEQVELIADGVALPATGSRTGELAGRVVAYGYHGHDAVIHVRPEQAGDVPTIIVRTLGGPELPTGSPVMLRARGPVLAWPHEPRSRSGLQAELPHRA
jgi:iron(III) transport system ATP-binding protein